jgi:hypothetical protein
MKILPVILFRKLVLALLKVVLKACHNIYSEENQPIREGKPE